MSTSKGYHCGEGAGMNHAILHFGQRRVAERCYNKKILSNLYVYNPGQCAGVSIILFLMTANNIARAWYAVIEPNCNILWGPHISRGSRYF